MAELITPITQIRELRIHILWQNIMLIYQQLGIIIKGIIIMGINWLIFILVATATGLTRLNFPRQTVIPRILEDFVDKKFYFQQDRTLHAPIVI